MAEITDDEIAEAALAPKRMKSDGLEVEERSVDELMKAAGIIRGLGRGSGWGAALRPARAVLPGAVGPAHREG